MSSSSAQTAPDYVGYGLAIAGAALFSSKGIFIKLAYGAGIGAETALALRMIVALPVFIAIGLVGLWRAPQLWARLTPKRLVAVGLVGILGYYISSYLDFAGLMFVSAQYERLVLFTYPFIAMAFGVWFFGDRMIWAAVPALILSYLGLMVIFMWNLAVQPDGLWQGTALVLISAVTYALYLHLARQQMKVVGAPFFTCFAMGVAGICAIAHNTIAHGIGQYWTLSGEIWLYGLALGIVGTVVPAFLLNTALTRIGARAAASTGAWGPIATIALAVWILGEPFTPFHAVGAAMVLVGSTWFGRAEHRAKS